jgi:hypothetical protein
MRLPAPVIAQISELSRRATPLPDVEVSQDGLLRRKGIETPLVDELLFDGCASTPGRLDTVMTESFDNPDPGCRTTDRIRASERSLWLSTVMTKGFDDPDPGIPTGDRIHLSERNLWLTTVMTWVDDKPDPGFV